MGPPVSPLLSLGQLISFLFSGYLSLSQETRNRALPVIRSEFAKWDCSGQKEGFKKARPAF